MSWDGGFCLLVSLPLLLFLFYFPLPQRNFWPKEASGFPCDWFQLASLGGPEPFMISRTISRQDLSCRKSFLQCPTRIRRPVGVIQFWRETGNKLIYQLIKHNPSIFIIAHFRHVYTSFCSAMGVVPTKEASFKAVFAISNSTSLT